MPAKTFLALLLEGGKLEIYEQRFILQASAYPYLEADDQDTIRSALTLPEDIMSDILESEITDDINQIKDVLNNGN